ncbi:hypothetical protein DDP54_02630 [Cellulomonas sp. WB94]|uniref:hypothetical protein n=1 Tax=Cellulomonas sp. WB94 TaxID=2173174 RepID=UPI000D576331|nr:hypothetical protein [Cellulomonas sp. WB94]PVU82085.1 hypothetical protein DDP54_02630 [Cellulomonas sp. WB94]
MTTPHEDTPRPPGWALPNPSSPPPGGPGAAAPGAGPVGPPAPGGPAAPGVPPAPGWGPAPGSTQPPGWGPAPGYGGPGYGGPGYGQPGPPSGYGVPAWRPPALQPGIVPLRPLGLGEILDGSFRAIRANPRVMFGLSAAVVAVVVAIQAVLTWYVGGLIAGALDDLARSADPTGELGLADQFGPSLATILTTPFVALATTLLTGLLIVSVSRSVIGQKISVGEVNRIARGRIWWVVGFTVLLGLAWSVAFALYGGSIALLASQEQWGALAAVALAGGLALAVGVVWVTVRTLLVPAALMLEGARFWATVRRAWLLTRGSFWRLFGIYLLVQVIVGVVASIIVYPVTLLSMVLFQDPTMTSFGQIALTSAGSVVAQTLSTVFSAAVIALLYIDVRMRREGLDVELARAAETAA